MIQKKTLSGRYQDMLQDPHTKIVRVFDLDSSSYPLASFAYRNCNGVILLGLCEENDGVKRSSDIPRNHVVLTHYGNTKHQPPLTRDQIFTYMRKAVGCFNGSNVEEIIAAVLGGDERHHNTILDFLQRNHISVEKNYLDYSSDAPEPGYRPCKNVVVSPVTEEAILLVDNSRYVKLL